MANFCVMLWLIYVLRSQFYFAAFISEVGFLLCSCQGPVLRLSVIGGDLRLKRTQRFCLSFHFDSYLSIQNDGSATSKHPSFLPLIS